MEHTELNLSVEAVAALVGLTPDDECTPDGIDWGYTSGPADGAPVFLRDGYCADDGNAEVHYPHADTSREAAETYADGFDRPAPSDGTYWVRVTAWQQCWSVTEDGEVITGRYGERTYTIAIEPGEPECIDGHDHDWKSPHDIVGGIESNPGVWGHAGGVLITEVCMHCGCGHHIDTWAQDPETGEQGLRSVRYVPGEFAEYIPTPEQREMREQLSCVTLADAAAYVLAEIRGADGSRCLRDLDGDAETRATEVAEFVMRFGHHARRRRAQRLALWLATTEDERERRAAEAISGAEFS